MNFVQLWKSECNMIVYLKHFISVCFGGLLVSFLYSGYDVLTVISTTKPRSFSHFIAFAIFVFVICTVIFGFTSTLIWSWLHRSFTSKKSSWLICTGSAVISVWVNLFVLLLIDRGIMKYSEILVWFAIPAPIFSSVFYWYYFIKRRDFT